MQERPAPAIRHSTSSYGGTADSLFLKRLLEADQEKDKLPNEEDRHNCRTGADGTRKIAIIAVLALMALALEAVPTLT
jgi:hypothetical protein